MTGWFKYGLFLLLTGGIIFSGCRPTRHLREGELLYRGSEFNFKEPPSQQTGLLKGQLEGMQQPEPNSRLLGLPIRLGIFYTFNRKNKEKGLGHWIQRHIGEAPVLYDPAQVRRTRLRMETFLHDQGYLQAEIRTDTSLQGKKITIQYQTTTGPLYRLRRYELPPDSSTLAELVRREGSPAPLAAGAPLELDQLKTELRRLAERAQEDGFYLVNPDHFFFYLDTLAGDHQADLYLRIRPATDSLLYNRYRIGRTFVAPNYQLDEEGEKDTLRFRELYFIQYDTFFRPELLSHYIRQREGEWYAPELQKRTLSHLSGLGIYKFVNQKYQRRQTGDTSYLDRLLLLTPDLPQSYSAEIEATTQGSNAIGSKLQLSYTHRNLFRGAEQLRLSLSAGVQTEIGKNISFINSAEVTAEATLEIPRFLSPFPNLDPRSISPPRTVFRFNDQFQSRNNAFQINSFLIQTGYRWQPTRLHRHELYPLTVSQVKLLDSTTEFDSLVQENPRLKASFSDVFILGLSYRYLYSELEKQRTNRFFFLVSGETAGNLANVFSRLGRGEEKLFGTPFSRFIRLEGDGRHYFQFDKENSLITRLNLGVGIAYGQTSVLPYSKQFFVGGNNSIRAFRIRRLGPGSDSTFVVNTDGYADQTGDLKLVANLEYRFPLISYLKGALFVDAGNIWLLRDPGDTQENGQFAWDRFYRELAVGAGAGLRLDIGFLVVRLDVATPLRKPWLPPGDRWVLDEVGLKGEWLWNLAIGYPF